jgi:hypothetical protein
MNTTIKILLLIIFILPTRLMSQSEGVKFVTTTILDSVDKRLKGKGGNEQNVSFNLVEKTVEKGETVSTKKFVSINISNIDVNSVGFSTGFAVTSNMDFALGRKDNQEIQRSNETITLGKADLQSIKEFLNKTIVNQSKNQEKDIGWSLEIDNKFTVSLVHNTAKKVWVYFIKINNAVFSIPLSDGKKLMGKLVSFEKEL